MKDDALQPAADGNGGCSGGALAGLRRMVDETNARRAADRERYNALDMDECQLCGAYGADKRSLRIECGYAIHEVVPEAIDARGISSDFSGYYMLICKSCRGRLLTMLGEWRKACLAMRGTPMDHDGHPEYDDPDRTIPVRVNGAIQMLTLEEWNNREASALATREASVPETDALEPEERV